MSDLDLSHPQRVHIVGVGGAGMSAIATVLLAMGHTVSGSDLKPSAAVDRLRALGVDAAVGHHAAQVGDADFVTISSAVPASNVEVREAEHRGIRVLRRAETLAAIAATRRTIAVAGTHGKTTTSSMLALILVEAGLHPSFIIGGDITEVGSGAAWGAGDWLVVEADESDGTFLELRPEIAVVTNVEPDHLDHYGSFAVLEGAFRQFLRSAAVTRVTSADDRGTARLAGEVGAVTFGTALSARYRMVDLRTSRSRAHFHLDHDGVACGDIDLVVPGAHNARNACAAVVTALLVGVPFDAARRALGRYGGVARRFEFRGERDGVTYVDDYAHLPTEVSAVLAAGRDGGWTRIVAVFQPHRYTRTAALWRDFADAFDDADVVLITDVYGAGEPPQPGISGRLVLDAVVAAHPDKDVTYLPRHRDLVARLRSSLRAGDLCLTLGAGDLTTLPDELLEATV